MAEAVTAIHHSIWRHLLDSIHAAAKKEESTLEFVTLDKESNMRTLWKREKFAHLCSEQQMPKKTQEVEEKLPFFTIPVYSSSLYYVHIFCFSFSEES